MKKLTFKSVVAVSFLTTFSALVAAAQVQTTPTGNEIEASCRIKAKEVAADTYRTCVVDQRSAQIEQIKKEYQEKLAALKAHYEEEIKKLAGSNNTKAKAEVEKSAVQTEAVPPSAQQTETEPVSETISEVKVQEAEVKSVEVVVPTPVVPKKSTATKKANSGAVNLKVDKTKKSAVNRKEIKIEKKEMINVQDMSVQLKAAPAGLLKDANGDLPEPIPVESTQDASSL